MDDLKHECGVAAISHAEGRGISELLSGGTIRSASRLMPRMLLDIQNRGQLAAGMSSYDSERQSLIRTYKDLGTVTEAFRINRPDDFASLMGRLDGRAAIGHVRYATCGGDDVCSAQPFEREHNRKSNWFAFAFNGQIANHPQIRQEFLDEGDYHLQRDTDTEILMHAISQEIRKEGDRRIDWAGVFGRLAARLDGAYNVVLLSATGELVVVRDPLGFRPLSFAQDGPLFAAASESVPLANLGFEEIESLDPGTLIVAGPKGVRMERFAEPRKPAHCFFEWIYFANVAGTLDDRSVYLSRAELGRELADLEDIPLDDNTIVVPVPDTAKAAADAMAHRLRLPSVEGVIRNRHIGRTFIEGTSSREDKVRQKYTPLRDVLQGKRVLLVEDSIVRSTTLRALVRSIRHRGGAAEVHLRIACPPIVAPCFYGIAMSTLKELVAPRFADMPDGGLSPLAQQKLAEDLGADSLRYLSVDAIARAIGKPPEHLCRACVTTDYPTETGQELYQIERLKPPEAVNGVKPPLAYEPVG